MPRAAVARALSEGRAFSAAVALLVASGVVLRVLTTVGYWPANVSHPDTGSYVSAAAQSLFSSPFRPVGYALFLRVVHALSAELWFTVAVQHVIGLATAFLAFRLGRQVGARRGVALLPAAMVLLSGDQLYFEYSLLSDGLFLGVLLLGCSLALSVTGVEDGTTRPRPWVVMSAAGLTALSATVRTVGVALLPVLVLWLLRYGEGPRAIRIRQAAAALTVCLAVVVGYAAAQQQATGVFGLTRFGGWPLYARVAPIADCHRFTPPAHTSILCDVTPVGLRSGPDFYLWNPWSPAQWFLGLPPSHAAQVGAFARSVILHEPLSYLAMVARDLGRYIDPSLVTAPQWGADWRGMALNQPWHTPVAFGLAAVGRYYGLSHPHVRQGLMDALEQWRGIARIHGPLIALSLLLCAGGLLLSRDRRNSRGLLLLAAYAFVLIVVPTATMSYEARYGVPGSLLLLIAGVRGAELAVVRLRAGLAGCPGRLWTKRPLPSGQR